MTTMTDEVSRPLLLWAANRTVAMHSEAPSESRPWAGRCAACGPDGCEQLQWAFGFLEDSLTYNQRTNAS